MQDFWTADIAGLYATPGADGEPVRLIDLSVAGADARPVTKHPQLPDPSPKSGYFYAALRPPDEADWWEPARFGFCSYPAKYGATGTLTFIVGEENVLYMKDLGRPGGIEVYPADPVGEGWTVVD